MFGFPNLTSGLSLQNTGIALLGQAEAALWSLVSGDSGWAVYNTGTTEQPVLVTSIVELVVRGETQLADYKIESGGFVSYDKVQRPNQVPLRLTKEGSAGERANLTAWLESALKDVTQLYDLATPETFYESMTLTAYTIQRNASSGAALLVVDCLFQEVRLIPQTYVNSTTGQSTSTAPTTNAVNPSDKPPSLMKRVTSQIPAANAVAKIAGRLGWS